MSNYREPMISSIAHLFSSVGTCGTNAAEDVKNIQKIMMNAGYRQATGRELSVSGQCGQATIEAIRWYQSLLNMYPSGLVYPVDSTFINVLRDASSDWCPKHQRGSLMVREGQFTFDNEGVDYAAAVEFSRQPVQKPYFSRVLYWPEINKSGVTLGRGYDMGECSRGAVYTTLRQAGIEEYKASLCARAAGLKGKLAGEFVRIYGPLFGEITHRQQIQLFEITFKTCLDNGKRIFDAQKQNASLNITWENINQRIKDVYIDSVFQGYHSATVFAKLILQNDIKAIRHYLRTDGEQASSFGRNFKRIMHISAL